MSKLTTKQRKSFPTASFAGPKRSYPIEDKSHARNAIARATQQKNKGNLSIGEAANIIAKARRKLGG